MGQATIEQANLLLRLYEIRREPRLREARAFMASKFEAKSFEDMAAICPPGSEENASFRMALSYWEMATSLGNRGLIDEDLFFENSGEAWFIWNRVQPVIQGMRAAFKNPRAFHHLETFAKRFEAWRARHAQNESPEVVATKTVRE